MDVQLVLLLSCIVISRCAHHVSFTSDLNKHSETMLGCLQEQGAVKENISFKKSWDAVNLYVKINWNGESGSLQEEEWNVKLILYLYMHINYDHLIVIKWCRALLLLLLQRFQMIPSAYGEGKMPGLQCPTLTVICSYILEKAKRIELFALCLAL